MTITKQSSLLCSLVLIVLCRPTSAAPRFWVRCTSCEVTDTNSVSKWKKPLFFCGTGMHPTMFAVLAQCEKCSHLATANLMEPHATQARADIEAGRKPDYSSMQKHLVSVSKAYAERIAKVTNACPLCNASLKIVYFPYNKLPESGQPEEVRLPLPAPCPSCSNRWSCVRWYRPPCRE
jgi:hypothetical protein